MLPLPLTVRFPVIDNWFPLSVTEKEEVKLIHVKF
jgi:hypothetical protein